MQANTILRQIHWESQKLSRFFVLILATFTAWLIATWPLELAAVVVVGAIILTLVFIQPRYALYILPFVVPFGSIYDVPLGPAMIGATEVLLALFFMAWIARGIARRELRLEPPPLLPAIALWYGIMLLSTLVSTSLELSFKELIKWAEVFALYTIATKELERRDIPIMVATTLAAGTLASIEGIYQSWYAIGPESFQFRIGEQLWLRAYGEFIQPNPYAGYLGLVLPLAYGIIAIKLGLQGEQAKEHGGNEARGQENEEAMTPIFQRLKLLLLTGTSVLIIVTALVLTLSRGGMLGVIAAAITVGGLLNRRIAAVSLAMIGAVALGIALNAVALLPPNLKAPVTEFLQYGNFLTIDVRTIPLTPENFSVLERLVHWDAAYHMWADAPWLGHGIGNYSAVYADYRIPPWDEPLGHAHNLILNTLAETGIIGLIAYLFFWGSCFWLTFRATQCNKGILRGIAIGILGALVHLHIHNLFDNLYVHGIYLHLALMLAIIAIVRQADSSHNSSLNISLYNKQCSHTYSRNKYDASNPTNQTRHLSKQS